MSVINGYLNKIKNEYPNTKEVSEQIEELRDTLHQKTEEFQAQGQGYEQAANSAIFSIGDVTGLFEELSGTVKTVYINRLNKKISLLMSALTLGVAFECWLLIAAISYQTFYYDMGGWGGITMTQFAILIGGGAWVAVMHNKNRKDPDKTQTISFPYRKRLKRALISFIALSLFLLMLNIFTGISSCIIWAAVVMGIWPLRVFIYHRQLKSGKYDVL